MQINGYKPLIVAFCCNWCSYAGADLAGNNRLNYPADVKIFCFPCSIISALKENVQELNG